MNSKQTTVLAIMLAIVMALTAVGYAINSNLQAEYKGSEGDLDGEYISLNLSANLKGQDYRTVTQSSVIDPNYKMVTSSVVPSTVNTVEFDLSYFLKQEYNTKYYFYVDSYKLTFKDGSSWDGKKFIKATDDPVVTSADIKPYMYVREIYMPDPQTGAVSDRTVHFLLAGEIVSDGSAITTLTATSTGTWSVLANSGSGDVEFGSASASTTTIVGKTPGPCTIKFTGASYSMHIDVNVTDELFVMPKATAISTPGATDSITAVHAPEWDTGYTWAGENITFASSDQDTTISTTQQSGTSTIFVKDASGNVVHSLDVKFSSGAIVLRDSSESIDASHEVSPSGTSVYSMDITLIAKKSADAPGAFIPVNIGSNPITQAINIPLSRSTEITGNVENPIALNSNIEITGDSAPYTINGLDYGLGYYAATLIDMSGDRYDVYGVVTVGDLASPFNAFVASDSEFNGGSFSPYVRSNNDKGVWSCTHLDGSAVEDTEITVRAESTQVGLDSLNGYITPKQPGVYFVVCEITEGTDVGVYKQKITVIANSAKLTDSEGTDLAVTVGNTVQAYLNPDYPSVEQQHGIYNASDWITNAIDLAPVNSHGLITAKAAGTPEIRATIVYDGFVFQVKGTCTITA